MKQLNRAFARVSKQTPKCPKCGENTQGNLYLCRSCDYIHCKSCDFRFETVSPDIAKRYHREFIDVEEILRMPVAKAMKHEADFLGLIVLDYKGINQANLAAALYGLYVLKDDLTSSEDNVGMIEDKTSGFGILVRLKRSRL